MNKSIFNMPINKFVAIVTSIAALVFLTIHMVTNTIVYRAGGLYDVVINFVDYALLAISYIVLLVMNIRNDDRAYIGITLMLTYVAIDALFYSIQSAPTVTVSLFSGDWKYAIALLFSFICVLWQLAMGILSYIFIFRYRMGRTNNDKSIFLFLILFVVATLLFQLCTLYLNMSYSSGLSVNWTIGFIAITLSLLCGGVAMIFTFKRLRRL